MEICAQVIKNAAGCGSTAAVKHCIDTRQTLYRLDL